MANKNRSTVPQGTTGGNGLPGSGTNSGATSTEARAGVIAQAPASSTFMPTVGATPNYSTVGARAGNTAPAPASSTFMPATGATPTYSARGDGGGSSGYMPGTPRPAGATPELIPLPIAVPPTRAGFPPGEEEPDPTDPNEPREPGEMSNGLPRSKQRK